MVKISTFLAISLVVFWSHSVASELSLVGHWQRIDSEETLVLNQDGTYRQEVLDQGSGPVMEGRWKLEGNTIELLIHGMQVMTDGELDENAEVKKTSTPQAVVGEILESSEQTFTLQYMGDKYRYRRIESN